MVLRTHAKKLSLFSFLYTTEVFTCKARCKYFHFLHILYLLLFEKNTNNCENLFPAEIVSVFVTRRFTSYRDNKPVRRMGRTSMSLGVGVGVGVVHSIVVDRSSHRNGGRRVDTEGEGVQGHLDTQGVPLDPLGP